MVAEFDRRRKVVVEGLNRLPGVSCATPRARSMHSQHQAYGLEGEGAASSLLRRPASQLSAVRFRRARRRLCTAVLRQLDREHPQGPDRMGEFLVREKPRSDVAGLLLGVLTKNGGANSVTLLYGPGQGGASRTARVLHDRGPPNKRSTRKLTMQLSEEQRLMRQSCRQFVDDVVIPFIRKDWRREWLMTPEDRLPPEIARAEAVGIRTLGVPRSSAGSSSMRHRGADLCIDRRGDRPRRFRARRQAGAELEGVGAAAPSRAASAAGAMVQAPR